LVPLVVDVEEVGVETGLQDARQDHNSLRRLPSPHPPHPVEQVEGPVSAQRHQVVRGDGFRFPSLLQHEELGEDGDALQQDGEGPEELYVDYY